MIPKAIFNLSTTTYSRCKVNFLTSLSLSLSLSFWLVSPDQSRPGQLDVLPINHECVVEVARVSQVPDAVAAAAGTTTVVAASAVGKHQLDGRTLELLEPVELHVGVPDFRGPEGLHLLIGQWAEEV